jgi:hypothetical protein
MKQVRDTYDEVTAFSTRAYKTGNSYFCGGIFESMLIQVIEELPKSKRVVFLDRLKEIDAKFLVVKEVSK